MRGATPTLDASHRPGRAPGRRGTTLAEMLVALIIIAILAGFLAAAVLRYLGVQQAQVTASTLQKVASELDKQVKQVVSDASNETVPVHVVTLAGGNPRRARVIWFKMRLRQEFPTSYAEALNPIPTALLQPAGPLAAGDLPPKNVFVQALPAAANDPTTESSACLLLALTQARGGITWDAANTLGAGFVRDTDGDGLSEIVDAWGKPCSFVRVPVNNVDLNPNGLVAGVHDAQDPDGLLSNPSWVSTPYGSTTLGALFGQLCHPVQGNASFQNLYPYVASSGLDKVAGTGDDLFSYRFRSMGAPVNTP
jgi:prepilin-type N-terminal cleavage/methylation domain-containing protein